MLKLYIPGPRGHARPFANDYAPGSPAVFEGTVLRQLEDLPPSWAPLVEHAEALRAACYAADPPTNDVLAALASGQSGGMEFSMEALELCVLDDPSFIGTRHGSPVCVESLLAALKAQPRLYRSVRGASTTTPLRMGGDYLTNLIRGGIDLADPEVTSLTTDQQEQIRRGEAWIEGDTVDGLRIVTNTAPE
jgi:hypothetical protein